MKKYAVLPLAVLALASFSSIPSLKGVWVYSGGVYNGKPENAPSEYTMQRKYTDDSFAAYAYQKGYKTQKYEAGNYTLTADSCMEKQTFSSQPSGLLGKTVHYAYTLKDDELILSGTLPTGMVVEEHWKRVK